MYLIVLYYVESYIKEIETGKKKKEYQLISWSVIWVRVVAEEKPEDALW